MLSRTLLRALRAPSSSVRTFSSPAVTKTTTGLVGLPVHQNPIPALVAANHAVLTKLQDIPTTAGYRINAEKVANFRIAKCDESEGSVEYIEKAVACGQIEELIVQAQDELEVVEMFIEDKLWEDVRRNEPIKKIEEKQEAEEGK